MDILVGVHIAGDYNPGINAAKISLDDKAIKHILRASKASAKDGLNRSTFDNSPELGTSDLDLESDSGNQYRDIAKLTDEKSQQALFGALPSEGQSEIVELHMDGTDFWWEGVFKHTDVHWETRMIPLSFLPQPITKKHIAALQDAMPFEADRTGYLSGMVQSGSLPDLNMTAEEMNAIHEKIASGMSHGLNAREIDRTFQRHVTKAQLIRLLMEHIERNH
jgi:hypothetical protein